MWLTRDRKPKSVINIHADKPDPENSGADGIWANAALGHYPDEFRRLYGSIFKLRSGGGPIEVKLVRVGGDERGNDE